MNEDTQTLFNGEPRDIRLKFNVTLKELEAAVEYAKKNGRNEWGTITLSRTGGNVGGTLFAAQEWNSEAIDISDYDSM